MVPLNLKITKKYIYICKNIMIKNLLTFLAVILAMLLILGIIDIKYINVFIVVVFSICI